MEKIIEQIEQDIFKKIEVTQKHLDNESSENIKQFLRGQIQGLRLALIIIPLKETIGVECDDV